MTTSNSPGSFRFASRPSKPNVATVAYRFMPDTHEAPMPIASVEMKSIAEDYTTGLVLGFFRGRENRRV